MRLVIRLNDKKKSKIVLTHKDDVLIVMYKNGLLFLNDKLIVNEQQFVYKKKSLARKDHNMLKYLDAFLDKITKLSSIRDVFDKSTNSKARIRDVLFSNIFTVNNVKDKQLYISKSTIDEKYEVYLSLTEDDVKNKKKVLRKLSKSKDLEISSLEDLQKFREYIKPILG